MKKTKPFQVRFTEEIYNELKEIADEEHTTSSEIIRRLVFDYIKKVKSENLKTESRKEEDMFFWKRVGNPSYKENEVIPENVINSEIQCKGKLKYFYKLKYLNNQLITYLGNKRKIANKIEKVVIEIKKDYK